MVITWYGHSCFRIQSGELVIVFDPFAKEIGLTPPRFKADIVLVSHAHYDHSNAESLSGEPFLISGPGEYEVKGIYARGVPTYHDASRGKERGTNTIYVAEVEGIRIAHLGDFGEGALRDETLSLMGDIDILLLPVGGVYTIDANDAAKIVKQVEPRFVIPMHYQIPGLKVRIDPVDSFLKEMGAGKIQPVDRLTVKKKDTEEEKTEVVVMKPA